MVRRSGSSNWRGLKLGFDVFRAGLRWVINNGQRVSFWHDRWIGDAPLRSLVHGPLSLSESLLRVCDVVGSGSVWNLAGLSLLLPTPVVEAIRATYVCSLRPKLNTDGSSLGNPGIAGGGGVIRDSCGSWLGGFSRTIGHTTSVQAELRALLDGMQLALELHITHLDIEMDSLVSVDLVLSNSVANVFLRSIVDDCRCMMEKFASVTLKHIYREANACADLLAKEGCSQVAAFYFFYCTTSICAGMFSF
uniref:RNase H type-1 domain-containing protein n=1 Tax=Fagus sylvatica TaxID=28930 RepID=A0A2N9HGS1_FAGSY